MKQSLGLLPTNCTAAFSYHRQELAAFSEAVMSHSGVPKIVEDVINAMPHDAHPMAIILTGLTALSGCHPEQNPALAGQNVYKSREVQDQQIARLIGKVWKQSDSAFDPPTNRNGSNSNEL